MFEIYWLTRVDALNTLFGWMIAIPVIVGIIMFIVFLIEENWWLSFKKYRKKFRNVLLPGVYCWNIRDKFLPNKK